jgi:hypothetical protein
VSTAACTFAPWRRLASSYPARAPDSGVDCSVRLSTTIAVGCDVRPANSRRSERKSSTMTSKHPALGIIRQCAPVLTSQWSALNTVRMLWDSCPASSRHKHS